MTVARAVAALMAAGGLAACGPIEATSHINQAEVAFAGAEAAGSEDYAPYEHTTAELFLEKAREERGFARFQSSVRYARKSAQASREARSISRERVREGEPDAANGGAPELVPYEEAPRGRRSGP